MTESTPGQALTDLVVLDCTQGIAGPYCSLQLATLGATVIKLEPPTGDWMRRAGPPFVDGVGAAAYQLNRGKRSVAVDLDTPQGVQILRRLLRGSDVLLHDMTESVAESRGLTPPQLRTINPRLIDCSVTPFGETGPWADLPATESEIQFTSGTWRYLGVLGEPPVRVGADVAGILGGCTALQAILAALASEHGLGQHLATSELGALMGVSTVMVAALDDPDTWDGFHTNAATYPPDRGIRTADGRIYYGQPLRSEQAWVDFCREIGAEALLRDPRFATREMRMPNQALLRRELEPYFERFSTEDLVEKVVRSDGIAVPIQDQHEVIHHPQLAALGAVRDADGMSVQSPPWRDGDDQIRPITAPAPGIGVDTHDVLTEFGFLPDELGQLASTGAIPGAEAHHQGGTT
ncbi:CaiB/BaiF CoA-transferase family protein [Nocardioides sp. KR10-350]|uniref:CaiB/BaiF CoA transferase family protein n=1 Tax=Nocardioides cheoyonin TaxID=3156615 RepID=UPI0032B46434